MRLGRRRKGAEVLQSSTLGASLEWDPASEGHKCPPWKLHPPLALPVPLWFTAFMVRIWAVLPSHRSLPCCYRGSLCSSSLFSPCLGFLSHPAACLCLLIFLGFFASLVSLLFPLPSSLQSLHLYRFFFSFSVT